MEAIMTRFFYIRFYLYSASKKKFPGRNGKALSFWLVLQLNKFLVLSYPNIS